MTQRNKDESMVDFVKRCMLNVAQTDTHRDPNQIPAPESRSGLRWNKDTEATRPNVNAVGIRHLMSTLAKKSSLDGTDYLVCPTILMLEGVHNNIYYPAEELSKFPESWNSEPVVVDHPMQNGVPQTAGSPEEVEKRTVGKLFNCHWDDVLKALKGDVWIDVLKATEVAPDLMLKILENEQIDVSTGLFTETDKVAGTWNNENYIGTVYNYRPDHLALLPNDVGACSWADGAGLMRNKEEDSGMIGKLRSLVSSLAGQLGVRTNELSHDDIYSSLYDAVRGDRTLANNEYIYIKDVFDKTFVYVHETGTGVQMMQQGYAVDANDKIEFVGDAVEVQQTTSYSPITNQENETGNADDQGAAATEGGDALKTRAERVTALIAKGVWVEADSEMLTNMSDEQFEKLEKTVPATEEPAPVIPAVTEPVAPVPNVEAPAADADTAAAPAKKETLETLLANLEDPALKDSLAALMSRDKAAKEAVIAALVANDACSFTQEELAAKSMTELGKLAEMSRIPAADYSGAAPAGNLMDNSDEVVPDMPIICAAKEED